MSQGKPTTLEELRLLIAQQSDKLTPRMRDAASYAMEHPNDIALNPVAAVAAQSGIAPPAFIRLAKALGCAPEDIAVADPQLGTCWTAV